MQSRMHEPLLYFLAAPLMFFRGISYVMKRSGLLIVGCVMTKLATHSAGVKFKCHRTGQRRLSIDDGRSGRLEQKKRRKGKAVDTKEGAMVIRSSRRDTAAAQSSSHGSEYKTTALKCAAQSSAWCKHPISPHCVLCLLTILGVPQCTPVYSSADHPRSA